MTNESPQIQKVTYRRGMLEDPKEERSGLKETILSRDSLTPKIVQSIHDNDLLSGAGIYGEKGVGDPVQYDYLKIEYEGGTVEITVYNRAIMLFMTDDEIYRRIHRLCCRIDDPSSAQLQSRIH